MAENLKPRSKVITDGPDRAPTRAMFKAVGFSDEDLRRPIIGVANTWIEIGPCNYHLRRLAAKVKEGIRAAGGTPMEFNTVSISDGISMGVEGMKCSLISREVIADSIELVARGNHFDALVCLSGCDKTNPGVVMALARLGSGDEAAELFHMLNPINHTRTSADVARYQGEPYVVAGDVCAHPEHAGRAGWTWYTGSAGWMYRLIVESLLGVHREGEQLNLLPRLPADWPGFTLRYRYRDTQYRIHVQHADAGAPSRLHIDGIEQPRLVIPLQDDRGVHAVEVWMARPEA